MNWKTNESPLNQVLPVLKLNSKYKLDKVVKLIGCDVNVSAPPKVFPGYVFPNLSNASNTALWPTLLTFWFCQFKTEMDEPKFVNLSINGKLLSAYPVLPNILLLFNNFFSILSVCSF